MKLRQYVLPIQEAGLFQDAHGVYAEWELVEGAVMAVQIADWGLKVVLVLEGEGVSGEPVAPEALPVGRGAS